MKKGIRANKLLQERHRRKGLGGHHREGIGGKSLFLGAVPGTQSSLAKQKQGSLRSKRRACLSILYPLSFQVTLEKWTPSSMRLL